MPERVLTEFENEFLARTAEARNSVGMTQEEMAQALGIKQDTYKWYEKRTLLPHHFVVQFCAITRKSIYWLYAARERRENISGATDR